MQNTKNRNVKEQKIKQMKSVDENIICEAVALPVAWRSERRYAGQSMDDSLRQTDKEKHPDAYWLQGKNTPLKNGTGGE